MQLRLQNIMKTPCICTLARQFQILFSMLFIVWSIIKNLIKFILCDFYGHDFVFAEPPEHVMMYQVKEDEDSVTVVCSAQEMFPKPILNITYKGR